MPKKRLRRSRGSRRSKKRSGATTALCQCACTGKGCKGKGETVGDSGKKGVKCEVLAVSLIHLYPPLLSPISRFYPYHGVGDAPMELLASPHGSWHTRGCSSHGYFWGEWHKQCLNVLLAYIYLNLCVYRKPEVALLCIVYILFTAGMNLDEAPTA